MENIIVRITNIHHANVVNGAASDMLDFNLCSLHVMNAATKSDNKQVDYVRNVAKKRTVLALQKKTVATIISHASIVKRGRPLSCVGALSVAKKRTLLPLQRKPLATFISHASIVKRQRTLSCVGALSVTKKRTVLALQRKPVATII